MELSDYDYATAVVGNGKMVMGPPKLTPNAVMCIMCNEIDTFSKDKICALCDCLTPSQRRRLRLKDL
jgi:hypothetical protein